MCQVKRFRKMGWDHLRKHRNRNMILDRLGHSLAVLRVSSHSKRSCSSWRVPAPPVISVLVATTQYLDFVRLFVVVDL